MTLLDRLRNRVPSKERTCSSKPKSTLQTIQRNTKLTKFQKSEADLNGESKIPRSNPATQVSVNKCSTTNLEKPPQSFAKIQGSYLTRSFRASIRLVGKQNENEQTRPTLRNPTKICNTANRPSTVGVAYRTVDKYVQTEDMKQPTFADQGLQVSPEPIDSSAYGSTECSPNPPNVIEDIDQNTPIRSKTQFTPKFRPIVRFVEPEKSMMPPPPPVPPPPPANIPPPPSFPGSSNHIAESPMPHNMKPKKTFIAPYRLKKACVSPVSKARLEPESVWVKIDESHLISDAFVKRLHRRFRIKDNNQNVIDEEESTIISLPAKYNTSKSTTNSNVPCADLTEISRSRSKSKNIASNKRSLNILPNKIAQNLAIAMASAHMDPYEVAQSIILLRRNVICYKSRNSPGVSTTQDSGNEEAVYTQILPDSLIEMLIGNMPPIEELLKLSDLTIDQHTLCESDRLIYFLSSLRYRLPAHLNAMRMLLTFDASVDQLKISLRTACMCLSEIRHSQAVPRILSCTLALVNALNAAGYDPSGGSKPRFGCSKRPLVGFELRNLTRLDDTKDTSGRHTLVDYLVELMEINFGKTAHNWSSDLPSLDSARRLYCAKQVEEDLVEIQKNIARLGIDLCAIGSASDSVTDDYREPDDTSDARNTIRANVSFRQVMQQFLTHAHHEQSVLTQLHETFSQRLTELAKYLVLDRSKYTADRLFSDLGQFRDMYLKTAPFK